MTRRPILLGQAEVVPNVSAEDLEQLRVQVSDRLVELEPLFAPCARLTFVMRSLHSDEGYFIVSSEESGVESLRAVAATLLHDAAKRDGGEKDPVRRERDRCLGIVKGMRESCETDLRTAIHMIEGGRAWEGDDDE